jgi:hypothetical protein
MMLFELIAASPRRPRLRGMIVLLLTSGVVVTPWIVRNYKVFGTFVPLRSNFGLELWLGNNPEANGKTYSFDWDDPSDSFIRLHPYASGYERDHLMQVGEIRYMQDKFHLAREWIITHPRRFTALTLRRLRLFWLPPTDLWSPSSAARRLKSVVFSVTAIAACANLIRLVLLRNPYCWLWVAALIGPSLVYTITHVDGRYRYPIFGLTILMTCDLALSGIRVCFRFWKFPMTFNAS